MTFRPWQCLDRLPVSRKLAGISFFFLIPDAVLLGLFLFTLNGHIRFAELELAGNEYQRPLAVLLEQLPRHHLMVRRAGADGGGGPNGPSVGGPEAGSMASTVAAVDAAFVDLASVQARLGERLQFTAEGLAKRGREQCRVPRLEAGWRVLRDRWPALTPAEREAGHRELMGLVRMMITHLGDNSNLILDPDLDSYYLMDVTLLALPQMQDRLGEVLGWLDDSLGGRELTGAERTRLAVAAALLRESDVDRVMASASTAMNEDANFYGLSPELHRNLRPSLARFREASDVFLAYLGGAATGEPGSGVGLSRASVLRAGEAVRQASFDLWRAAQAELDRLLERRAAHFRSRRAWSLALTGFALCGAVGLVTGITRSISRPLQRQAAELRASNDALREAEAKFRSIFENAVEGIFQSTPEGRYLTVNPTLARIYGYASPARMQEALTDIGAGLYVDPGRREEFQRRIQQEGEVHGFESQVRRADGTVIWISEHARVVRGADGGVLFYEGTVEDITTRKRQEEELERVHRELRDSHRVKNEFLANASHELLTPMNGICGFLDLLADTPLDEGQREFLGEARGCSVRLLRLIREILDFNDAEAGRLAVEPREAVPVQWLAGVTRAAAATAAQRGVSLILDPGPGADLAWRWPVNLAEKILLVLLDNALKFTAAGSITVSVTARGNELEFVVRDTGIGLTREQLEWIRIPFAQADGGATRSSSGIGLGLALANRLAGLAEGVFELTGEPGHGARARFTLRSEPVRGELARPAA